jgi:sigma-B regulation protein RsbU (phosphoserine phosphatase)
MLAAVLLAFFLYLRHKETEGVMFGFAFLAGFLALRDIAFAVFPLPFVYIGSDLVIFAAFAYLLVASFGAGWLFWIAAALDLAAVPLIVCGGLGIKMPFDPRVLQATALFPIAFMGIMPNLRRADADTPARMHSVRVSLPAAVFSALYLIAGVLLGRNSWLFQAFGVPLFYGLLFAVALVYVDISHKQLAGAVEYYEESVDSLYDLLLAAASSVRSEFSLQDVLDNTIRAIVERTGADGGLLLLADEFEESVSVRACFGSIPPPFKLPETLPKTRDRVESFVRHARFRLGEGLLGEVARTGKHLYVAQNSAGSPLPDNGDDDWLRVGALIAAPLIVRDRIIGAVAVVRAGEGSFTERDFDRCKLLANFASIAVANSFSFLEAAERSDIEREAAIAENVQRNLLPKDLPTIPGYALGAYTSPARGVCSDYYDVIQTRADKLLLAVGDVAGKGVAASLVLVMVRSILNLITASTKDAATLLQWVNRGITGKVDTDHFATLGLAALDAATGEIEFANAGHQPAIIYRAEADTLQAVEIKSIPIGVERSTVFESRRFRLGRGDILALYTDGIVETVNAQGKQFGRKNLGALIRDCRDLPPDQIVERIHSDVLDFAAQARQHDDQTLLILKRL